MNSNEAREYLGVSKDGLKYMVKKRQVPYGKRGKKLVFDRVDLDEWNKALKKKGCSLEEATRRRLKNGGLL